MWFQFKIICESMKIIHKHSLLYVSSSIVLRHDKAYHILSLCDVRTSYDKCWNTEHLPWSTCISNTIMYSVFLCVSECMLLGSFIGLHCTRFVYTHIKSTCCAHFLHLSIAAPSTYLLHMNCQWVSLMLLFLFFILLFSNRLHIFVLFSNMKYILSINRCALYSMLIFRLLFPTYSFSRSMWTLVINTWQ